MNKEALRIRKLGTKKYNKKTIRINSDCVLKELIYATTHLPSSHVPHYVDAHGEVHRRQL